MEPSSSVTASKTTPVSFLEKASRHWTKEREAKITGGKQWPVKPSEAPELLRVLGLLNADASMPADAVRKFSQINHMVTLLLPLLTDLAGRHAPLRILDAGCGTSPLTLILAWLLKVKLKAPACIVGIDVNPKVIATSRVRAQALGLDDSVRFAAAPLAGFAWDASFSELFPGAKAGRPHLLLALHACDTASDLALACGIRQGADAMAIAPCCHAELARKWKDLPPAEPPHAFAPVFQTPNLRREVAAQVTDTMRMLITRSHGYEVTATEFVPSAHTPKNRLLLCQRRGRYLAEAGEAYTKLKDALASQTITLQDLLASKPAGLGDALH